MTLIEMLIVVSLIGLVAAISFPSVSSGLDTLRLTSASDSVVSYLNAALNRAERRREAMEVTISRGENALMFRSPDPNYLRRLEMPEGVTIARILPEINPGETERVFLMQPGGTVPRLGIELVNRKGVRRIVRVNPITGVPMIEQ